MPGKHQTETSFDRASKSLPGFLFAGCIGGLLLGVIFGNIPYGVAAGVVLAPALWLVYSRGRSGKTAD